MGVLNFNGALYMATGIDNSGLKRDASEAERIIEGLGKTAQSVGAMMGVAFTLDTAKNLIGQVVNIRGEFQKLEAAFGVLLQSKSKATQMMQEAVELAGTTPFSLQDVASGSKQLLAYGFEAKDITSSLRMLGDVAAGLGLPLERLTYLYGTTLTQGKLMTRDLMQFTTSGIPLLQELANQFGVTTKEVQAMVEAGSVGFPEVQKAFEAMTGAGGKFHGMMEEISKTVTGRIEKLKDSIEVMFNEIGKSQEGVIYKAIDSASSLVESYKAVGSALADIVAAFGVYKGVMMVMEASRQITQSAKYSEEAKQLYGLLSVEQKAAVAKQGLAQYSAEYVAAVRTEVAANVEAAKSALNKAREEVVAANQTMAAKRAEYIAAKELEAARASELASMRASGTVRKVESVERQLAAAASKREAAATAFQSAARDFSAKKTAVETAAKQANTIATTANTAAQNANATASQKLAAVGATLYAKLGQIASALSPAIYIAAIAAFVELGKAVRQMGIEASKAAGSQEHMREVANNVTDAITSEEAEIRVLTTIIKSEVASRKDKEDAIDKLVAKAPDLLSSINAETIGTKEATEAINNYIEARRRQLEIEEWQGKIDETLKKKREAEQWGEEGKPFLFKAKKFAQTAARYVASGVSGNGEIFDKSPYETAKEAAEKERLKVIETADKDLEFFNGKIEAVLAKGKVSTETTVRATAAAAGGAKKIKKEEKEVAKALEELVELQRTARKRIEDAELEMMDEGLQKKLQKIDHTYQREIEEIEEWKKTLEKVNKKATGKKDLTKEQQEAYDISRFNAQLKLQRSHIEATDEWKRKEAEAYDEMLQAFGSYKEKQEAIAREYARKIADAEREGRTNEAEKQRREMIKAQANAAEQELGKDDTLKTFFKHTEKQTLQAAKKARAEIANTIKFLKTKGAEGVVDAEKAHLLERMLGDPELVRQTLDGLETDLEKVDDTIENIQHQKVFDALIANFKKLRKAASGTGEQMAALKGVINGIGSIGGMISQLGNAMSDCDIKAGKVVSTIGNALTNAASFAAAGASIVPVWGAVVGAASAIIPAIGKVEEWTDAMEKSYTAQAKWLEKVRDANLDIIKGYGSVEEKVKAVTEALQNNAKLLDLIHEKQEAQRNKKADKGDGHSIWYTNRQNVLSMLRGKGAFDNFEDHWLATPERDSRRQIDRMNRYKKYVDRGNVDPTQGWGLIDEEIRKGYRPKIQVDFEAKGIDLKRFMRDPGGYLTENDPQKGALKLEQLKWIINTFPEIMRELDSTTVANINERMELLKKEGETLKDALSEALTGVSFDGLLSEYERFLKQAADGSKDLGKSIEGHLRDAIVKGLIDKKTEGQIKKAYERIANIMQNRDAMSAEEFQKQLQDAKAELERIYKELAEKRKEAFDKSGLGGYDDNSKDNTLRGALAKASQESIDLLAGQMGAVRVTIEQILKLMNESRGKGGGMAEYYDSVRQSFTALYQLQIAGWKEVTVIKEVVQQMHVTQSVVASLSQTVAENTTSIKETSRRVSEGITMINNSGVKIKGGGLGL